jgi:hypothetical protein
MLTAEEKQVIADKMGLEVFCDGRVYNYELHRFMRFDLNDAGLVRDWLVERGEWNNFILSLFDNEDVLSSISSWLFVTENGEAVKFFRSFVKWCEEGNR